MVSECVWKGDCEGEWRFYEERPSTLLSFVS
jgi:hypothetical protein